MTSSQNSFMTQTAFLLLVTVGLSELRLLATRKALKEDLHFNWCILQTPLYLSSIFLSKVPMETLRHILLYSSTTSTTKARNPLSKTYQFHKKLISTNCWQQEPYP